MFGRKSLPLGGWLLFVLFLLGVFVIHMISSTILLRQGVTTKGVITLVGTEGCGRSSTGAVYSVQFTDQTGQVYMSTISQCTYSDFTASLGETVPIVYLPNDPTTIAPPDGLLSNVRGYIASLIISGLITLFLLPLWIRKRLGKSSLSRQEKLEAQRHAQEFDRKLAEALKQPYSNPEGDISDNPDHSGS